MANVSQPMIHNGFVTSCECRQIERSFFYERLQVCERYSDQDLKASDKSLAYTIYTKSL
nr:hypothetical protein [uncultured Christensenella sp.]